MVNEAEIQRLKTDIIGYDTYINAGINVAYFQQQKINTQNRINSLLNENSVTSEPLPISEEVSNDDITTFTQTQSLFGGTTQEGLTGGTNTTISNNLGTTTINEPNSNWVPPATPSQTVQVEPIVQYKDNPLGYETVEKYGTDFVAFRNPETYTDDKGKIIEKGTTLFTSPENIMSYQSQTYQEVPKGSIGTFNFTGTKTTTFTPADKINLPVGVFGTKESLGIKDTGITIGEIGYNFGYGLGLGDDEFNQRIGTMFSMFGSNIGKTAMIIPNLIFGKGLDIPLLGRIPSVESLAVNYLGGTPIDKTRFNKMMNFYEGDLDTYNSYNTNLFSEQQLAAGQVGTGVLGSMFLGELVNIGIELINKDVVTSVGTSSNIFDVNNKPVFESETVINTQQGDSYWSRSSGEFLGIEDLGKGQSNIRIRGVSTNPVSSENYYGGNYNPEYTNIFGGTSNAKPLYSTGTIYQQGDSFGLVDRSGTGLIDDWTRLSTLGTPEQRIPAYLIDSTTAFKNLGSASNSLTTINVKGIAFTPNNEITLFRGSTGNWWNKIDIKAVSASSSTAPIPTMETSNIWNNAKGVQPSFSEILGVAKSNLVKGVANIKTSAAQSGFVQNILNNEFVTRFGSLMDTVTGSSLTGGAIIGVNNNNFLANNNNLMSFGNNDLANTGYSKTVTTTDNKFVTSINNKGITPISLKSLTTIEGGSVVTTEGGSVVTTGGGEVVVVEPTPPVPITPPPIVVIPPITIPPFNPPPVGFTGFGGLPPFIFSSPNIPKFGGGGRLNRPKQVRSKKSKTAYTPSIFAVATGYRVKNPVKQGLFTGGELRPLIGTKKKQKKTLNFGLNFGITSKKLIMNKPLKFKKNNNKWKSIL